MSNENPVGVSSRISCGDVLFDVCSFLTRAEIDGFELVGSQWFSALRSVSSALPLRPLSAVVKVSLKGESRVDTSTIRILESARNFA